MNICIDMRPVLSRATGVGVYLYNLVRGLACLDSENAYHLFSSSWKERFQQIPAGKNIYIHDKHWPVRVLTYSWNHFSYPPIESLVDVPLDVVHSPTPLVIPSRTARKITTVHDLYFYFHPDSVIHEMRRDYPTMLREHCEKSDAVIAVSEHTKDQLVEHLKIASSKIYTVHHGADMFFAEAVPEVEISKVKRKYEITQPYFLFVGSLEPRKNLPGLLEAFHGISEDVQLVLAGPEGWGNDLSDLLSDRVLQIGYVPKSDLRVLYQQAISLVMPSFEEGFGLPLLEAMTASVPIIASGIPAFCEIGGDAFYAVDPENTKQIRVGMQEMFSNPSVRSQLIERGKERSKRFTWKETARKTLDIYRNL
jgi:glycosyltransferase involved in cell wall biosynthesis